MQTPLALLKHCRWPLLITVLVALPLRIHHLGYQNIWFDEAYSWSIAIRPIGEIVQAARSDIHPPLFYLILKGWIILFGSGEAALRSLSLVASLGTMWAGYRIVRDWNGDRAARWFLVIMAIAPHQIFFAQEARMYALTALFSLLAVDGYDHWFSRRRKSGLAEYIVFGLLAVYTHYFAFLLLIALQIDFLITWIGIRRLAAGRRGYAEIGRRDAASRGPYLVANLVMALCYLPWIPTLFRQFQRGQSWRTTSRFIDVLDQVRAFFAEILLGYDVYLKHIGFGYRKFLLAPWDWTNLSFLFLQCWMFIFGGALLVFLLARGAQGIADRRARILFAIPLSLGLLLSLRQSLQLSRYLDSVFPFFAMILATALVSLKPRWKAAASGTLLVTVMLPGLLAYYSTPSRDSDYRPIAELLRTRFQAEDSIIVEPDYIARCIEYYLRGTFLAERLQGPFGPGSIPERLARQTSCQRLWIIADYRSSLFSSGPAAEAIGWKVQDDQKWPINDPKIRVMLYSKPSSSESSRRPSRT